MTRAPLIWWSCLAALLFNALAAGCLNDAVEPTIDLNATPLPGTAITLPTQAAQPTVTPTPAAPPWLPPLLEPGPPAAVSPALFFLNGPDAWLITNDLTARQVTQQRRVRAVATVPGAASAAVLLIDTAGGRESEEIRIIDADGNASEPLYGPEIVGDPAGNPRVTLLRWSPDGQRLAIVRADASVWLAAPGAGATPLALPTAVAGIEDLAWAPSGAALALFHRSPNNAGALRIAPLDASGELDVSPLGSFGAVCWPPARANLVVSEDRAAGENPNAGSLFALKADGSERELLMSAGEFGPAIRIGKMLSSPDGAQLAFTVETPDTSGDFQFQALYIHEFDTGLRRRLEVAPGYAVSELWWFEPGLVWRATRRTAGSGYSGVEPFVIELADLEGGDARRLYTSDGA
jgi:dipeptidyl aminopeptidase/acylaminoacyl peptidase